MNANLTEEEKDEMIETLGGIGSWLEEQRQRILAEMSEEAEIPTPSYYRRFVNWLKGEDK